MVEPMVGSPVVVVFGTAVRLLIGGNTQGGVVYVLIFFC